MGLCRIRLTSVVEPLTTNKVTTTDINLALGWYLKPTVVASTVSFNESNNQKPPIIQHNNEERNRMRGSSFSRMSPYKVLMRAASFLERGVSRIAAAASAASARRLRRAAYAAQGDRKQDVEQRCVSASLRLIRDFAASRRVLFCFHGSLSAHIGQKNHDVFAC